MGSSTIKNQVRKMRRAVRVRKNLRGTANKPRLCVIKSNKHIYVQLINDELGTVLTSLSTCSKEYKGTDFSKKNKTTAKALGQKIAELVNQKLDAGRYSYQWNARNIATGMYIYELRTDKFVSVKKMIILK